MPPRLIAAAALGAASALVLTACVSAGADDTDGRIAIVASTNVYGQIAEVVGGDAVEVVAIIDSPAKDPHAYEPSARDQLRVARADLLIENGGGYDAFIDRLMEATETDAPILTAVEFSADWPGEAAHDEGGEHTHAHDHIEGFNEHVWYDLQAMRDLAAGIAAELGTLSPDDSDAFSRNADAFADSLATLESRLIDLEDEHGGTDIFVTEPVPLYLTEDAGLVNVTPTDFSEAVEEGQDVAPATLLDALDRVRSGDVMVVIANSQTGGVETDAVIAEAEAQAIPALEFSEVLPTGLTYLQWMEQNIIALGKGLHR